MSEDSSNKRSVTAVAYEWASRIMTVSLEMVVPGLLGYWLLDQNLGTGGLFTMLGFGLGMTLGVWHLIKMTSTKDDVDKR